MPPRRNEPAVHAASSPPSESYESIWSALSDAQRAAILAAIGSTGTEPSTAERPPALQETMHTLRHMLGETLTEREPADEQAVPVPSAGWEWQPQDNGLVGVNCDPALIVGGNAPAANVLVCQRVRLPAGAPVHEIVLDVVTPGSGLTAAAAAVYEPDGTRSGLTADQTVAWGAPGLHRMPLADAIPPLPAARSVWVGFVAAGAAPPAFGVPWISRAARPNLGLPDPGPQRAGEIAGQSRCPEAIVPADMRAGLQYWVGVA